MDTITILTNTSVSKLFDKYTSKELSELTGLPQSTLKNYYYKRTDLDNMPVSMRLALSKTFLYNTVSLNPSHYLISDEDWYFELSKLRSCKTVDDMDQCFDYVAEQLMANADLNKHLTENVSMDTESRRYYLIDFSVKTIVDLETLVSLALGKNISLLIRESTCPEFIKTQALSVDVMEDVNNGSVMNLNLPVLLLEDIHLQPYPDKNSQLGIINIYSHHFEVLYARDIIAYLIKKDVQNFDDLQMAVDDIMTDLPDIEIKATENRFLKYCMRKAFIEFAELYIE